MRYAHFNDQRREYVIERPDTPLPWINSRSIMKTCN
jgi:cellobiose phosphorylase